MVENPDIVDIQENVDYYTDIINNLHIINNLDYENNRYCRQSRNVKKKCGYTYLYPSIDQCQYMRGFEVSNFLCEAFKVGF